MPGWRGLLAGALGLAALYALVSPPPSTSGDQTSAASRVGGLLQLPGQWALRFLSPGVPAIGGNPYQSTATATALPVAAPSTPSPPPLPGAQRSIPPSGVVGAPVQLDPNQTAVTT